MAPSKKTAKPAANVTNSQPLRNDDDVVDDVIASEADLAAKRSKLISELVNERKKVEVLNKELNKKIREQVATVTKFNGVVKDKDATLVVKEVHLAQQLSTINTYKIRLAAQEQTHKAQKQVLTAEHDVTTSRLRSELEVKKTEARTERTRASVSTRDYSVSSDKANKLQLDLTKSRKDCDDFAQLLREAKSELGQAKKSLTTISKKVVDQHAANLAHKERMKELDVEKERIKFEKAKETNQSRLLSLDRSHNQKVERTEHRYTKADDSNLARHSRKTKTENTKIDTAVARASLAAAQSQQVQNHGHFPNPRGVDLERVSFWLSVSSDSFLVTHLRLFST
jgi:hypothetical protein